MVLDGSALLSRGRRDQGESTHALDSSRKNNLDRFKNVLRKQAERKNNCGGKFS